MNNGNKCSTCTYTLKVECMHVFLICHLKITPFDPDLLNQNKILQEKKHFNKI